MTRSAVYIGLLLTVTILFSGTLYFLGEQDPKVETHILNIAENSYFLGCVEASVKENLLPKNFIKPCKLGSKKYREELNSIMQSNID